MLQSLPVSAIRPVKRTTILLYYNNPCLNGGTCVDQVNAYVCNCHIFAPHVSLMYLLQVVWLSVSLWLPWVITLVLVVRHWIENRCNDNVIVIVHSVTVQVPSPCQGLLLEQTNARGIIMSNSIDENNGYYYQSNMLCQWNLVSASISKLELTFYIFNTELDADFLYIYDGDSSSSPLIDNFSGASLPSPITSSSNKLYLRFRSDTSCRLRGFTARYRGRVLFDHTKVNLKCLWNEKLRY